MLYSCQRCGRIHEYGRCTIKKPYRKKESTDITRFRSSAQWQHKRREILDRDSYACKACALNGRINSRGLQVHHIVSLSADFERRTDNDNLITLCEACHTDAHANILTHEQLRQLTKEKLTEILARSIDNPPVPKK